MIFTSQHLVPKLQSILSSFPNQIEFVVYFEHPLKKNSVFEERESANSIPSILPLSKIETSGQMLSGLKQGKQSSPKLLTKLNPVKTSSIMQLHLLNHLTAQNFALFTRYCGKRR